MRLKKLILVAVLAVAGVSSAEAGPIRNFVRNVRSNFGGGCQTAAVAQPAACQSSYSSAPSGSFGNSAQSVAEAHSQAQANSGRMFHPGGFGAGATHEGVGFSTVSPQDALNHCCYSNSGMAVVGESAVRGNGGWYATRQYSANGAPVTPVRTFAGNVLQGTGRVIQNFGTFIQPQAGGCANGVCPSPNMNPFGR